MKLVTQKGVYPYEYTDSWEKLDKSEIPTILEFYSKLTEKNIFEEEYQHVQNVWKYFECKTLGKYVYLLKIKYKLIFMR